MNAFVTKSVKSSDVVRKPKVKDDQPAGNIQSFFVTQLKANIPSSTSLISEKLSKVDQQCHKKGTDSGGDVACCKNDRHVESKKNVVETTKLQVHPMFTAAKKTSTIIGKPEVTKGSCSKELESRKDDGCSEASQSQKTFERKVTKNKTSAKETVLDSTKKSAIQKTSSEHSDQATRVVMQSRHCVKSARAGAIDIVTAPSRVVIVDCDSDESMSSVEERKTKSDSRGGKMLAKQVPSGDGSGSKILVPVPEETRRSKRQAVLAETKTSVQCMRDELSADDDFIVDSDDSCLKGRVRKKRSLRTDQSEKSGNQSRYKSSSATQDREDEVKVKKSSRAATFFLSKEDQVALEAREAEYELLVKQQERELRIQQQFQQEQLNRRAENQNGKSFTVTGSGVNPFFVLQKERAAAASSSQRPEGGGRGSEGASSGGGTAEYGQSSATTAESALMEFMAMVPLGLTIGLPSLERWRQSTQSIQFASRKKVRAPISLIEDTPSSSVFLDLSLPCPSAPSSMVHGSGHHDARHDASRAVSCMGAYGGNSLQLIDLWMLLASSSRSHPPSLSSFSRKYTFDERLASFSRALQERANNALQPKRASAVVGNKQGVRILLQWLEVWAGKRRAPRKSKKEKEREKKKALRRFMDSESEEDNLKEGLTNVFVIEGRSASGKTAAVHACATQLGFTIIEMNASNIRSAAAVKKQCAEAAQSHGLDIMAGVLARSLPDPYSVEVISKQSRSSTSSGKEKEKKVMEKEKNAFKVSPPSESNDCTNSPGADLNLILFDEVDTVLDEDGGLFAAILQLARSSKCPIVLTSQTRLTFLKGLPIPPLRAIFQRPSALEISTALRTLVYPALTLPDMNSDSETLRGDSSNDVVNLLSPEEQRQEQVEEQKQKQERRLLLSERAQGKEHSSPSASHALSVSLHLLATFSGGDFRACVHALQLCLPIQYCEGTLIRNTDLKPLPSVPHHIEQRGWNDASTQSASDLTVSVGGSLCDLFLFSAFDRLGDSLSALAPPLISLHSHPHPHLHLGPLYLTDCSSSSVSPVHEKEEVQPSATAAHDSKSFHQTASPHSYRGLIVPLIHGVSPRLCLVQGGELVTVKGEHFLQSRRRGETTDTSSDSPWTEEESRKELEDVLVRLEVLVSEVAVPRDQVFLLSDSELCFLFPPSIAGVARIVVRMVDDVGRHTSSHPPNPLHDGEAHAEIDSSASEARERKSLLGSSCAPVDLVAVRSDFSGSSGGSVLVRDRRAKDIRLFFAHQKKMTERDKEVDRERTKDKNISFFMTSGCAFLKGEGGSKWDAVDVEKDVQRVSVISRGVLKRKTQREEIEEVEEFSDEDGDGEGSGDFQDTPPCSMRRMKGEQRNTSALSAAAQGQNRDREGALAVQANGSKRRRGVQISSAVSDAAQPTSTIRDEEGGKGIDIADSDEDCFEVVKESVGRRGPGRRSRCVIDDDDDDDEDEGGGDVDQAGVANGTETEIETAALAVQAIGESVTSHTARDDASASGAISITMSEETAGVVDATHHASSASHLSRVCTPLSNAVLEALRDCVAGLMSNPLSIPFRDPVDPTCAPDYLSVISSPMDLSTIQSSLEEGLYSVISADIDGIVNAFDASVSNSSSAVCENAEHPPREGQGLGLGEAGYVDASALLADLRLVWKNCRAYNNPNANIVKTAAVLEESFELSLYDSLQELSLMYPSGDAEAPQGDGSAVEGYTGSNGTTVSPQSDAEGVSKEQPLCHLEARGGVVKICFGSYHYEMVFEAHQRNMIVDVPPLRTDPTVPSSELLSLLNQAESKRCTSVEQTGYTHQGRTAGGFNPHTALHRYPAKSSLDLYRSLMRLSISQDSEVDAIRSDPFPSTSGPLRAISQTLDPVHSSDADVDAQEGESERGKRREDSGTGHGHRRASSEGVRAVEQGCLAALETMWAAQHGFSTCDVLDKERLTAECFHPRPSPSSSSSSSSSSSENEQIATQYEESVEAALCYRRQRDMAHCISDQERASLAAAVADASSDPQTPSSRSVPLLSTSFHLSQSTLSRTLFRAAYTCHLRCLGSVEIFHEGIGEGVRPKASASDSLTVSEKSSGAPKKQVEIVDLEMEHSECDGGKNESRIKIDGGSDSEDEDDDEDEDEGGSESERGDEDLDEEEAFLEECRKIEEKDLAAVSKGDPVTVADSVGVSRDGVIIISNNISSSSSSSSEGNSKGGERRESAWSAVGRELLSPYLRSLLRKRELELFVNEVLCGEEGPFDNCCSSSLCPAMAMDLLPLLGNMARSESVRDARIAAAAATLDRGGDGGGDADYGDFGRKRRVSTRRSTVSVRARFQYLTCATQLSEQALEALLVFGFIAGGNT